ncbi:MAG: peptide deformylase [Gemmataceae bacterium]|nr:peptide deformylase [Gemmataceae bacterium]
MPLTIAQLGQPILRGATVEVPVEEIASPSFQQFLNDTRDTLRDAGGAGLAAPQVFDRRRVFLAAILPPSEPDGEPEIETFINPRLVGASDERAEAWEGCLSFPELLVLVSRPLAVRVRYLSERGEPCVMDLIDFPARVVQHEHDHLEGILTLDRAKSSRHIVKASEIDAFLGKDPFSPVS